MCSLDIRAPGCDDDGFMTALEAPAAPPSRTPRLPDDAVGRGLAFHRLVFARQRSAWWTPLLVGLLGVALYVVMLVIVVVAMIVVSLSMPGAGDGLLELNVEVTFDLTDPLLLAVLLGSIALMLPAYLLASLIVNGRRVGLISSAAGGIRWGWMLVSFAVAVVVAGVVTAISALFPGELEGSEGVIAPSENPQFWATLAVILLVIPSQAAAEEYVFRGYLQQAIGRWLRHPAFAILLPVPLFVLGHAYDPLGQTSVAVFAIAAGWMTWRTGGLEAAIALHIVNNLLAFLLGLAGLSDVNASSPGVLSFVVSFVMIAAYAGAIEVLFRRSRHHATLRLTPGVPAYVPADAQAAMASASKIV